MIVIKNGVVMLCLWGRVGLHERHVEWTAARRSRNGVDL